MISLKKEVVLVNQPESKKLKRKKILLVSLALKKLYKGTNIETVAPNAPSLSLACLAGSLINHGFHVEIFDFNLYEDRDFVDVLQKQAPDFVGITFVTPLIQEADRIAKVVKNLNERSIVIAGGPHCSALPEKTLMDTNFDVISIGEGDFTICEIMEGKDLADIQGIGYKEGNTIKINPKKSFIRDLDILPFPEYSLFEIENYVISPAIARKNPVAWIETSRGCVYNCIFCNKSSFGKTFRVKSPERVVEEFLRIIEYGFKEIYIADDGFTTDMDRAKKICDLLIKKGVHIGWSTFNGVRADRLDLELLEKMREAGCYRIYLGIESGSQKILDRIKKGITINQVEDAVKWCKKVGIEVGGLFMIGLPGDSEETMQETIDFAKKLNLELSKAAIAIPLPSTEMFNELEEKGLIKTYDWKNYNYHSIPSMIYNHQSLSWPVVEKYYNKFYRVVYLRPEVIKNKLKNSIKNRTLLGDIKTALSVKWF